MAKLIDKLTNGIGAIGNAIKNANETLANGNVQQPNTKGTELQYEVQQNNEANKAAMQPYEAQTPPRVIQKNYKEDTPEPQTVQNAQGYTQPSSVSAETPSDFYDSTVESYLKDYRFGIQDNDFQAQINALTAIDNYREQNGYAPIYSDTIYQLTNERTNKIKRYIDDYNNRIIEAYNSGNVELANQINQELNEYKKMVGYNDTTSVATVSNELTSDMNLDNPRGRYDPGEVADYIQKLEYRSDYDQIINGIMNELLTARFTYNPSEDEALIRAQQYAANTAYESMNQRGILNSTMTAQIVTATIANLIPTYEKMAREEFYDNVERLYSMANFVIDLDDRAYKRWQENTERNLAYYQALKDEADYQWDRVNQLGYVDNWASVVLGVAPGTLSPSARQAIQEQKDKIEQENIKLATDIAHLWWGAKRNLIKKTNGYYGTKRK